MSDRTWSDEQRRPPYEPPIDHYFKEVTLTCVAASIILVLIIWLLAFGLTGWAIAVALIAFGVFLAAALITSSRSLRG